MLKRVLCVLTSIALVLAMMPSVVVEAYSGELVTTSSAQDNVLTCNWEYSPSDDQEVAYYSYSLTNSYDASTLASSDNDTCTSISVPYFQTAYYALMVTAYSSDGRLLSVAYESIYATYLPSSSSGIMTVAAVDELNTLVSWESSNDFSYYSVKYANSSGELISAGTTELTSLNISLPYTYFRKIIVVGIDTYGVETIYATWTQSDSEPVLTYVENGYMPWGYYSYTFEWEAYNDETYSYDIYYNDEYVASTTETTYTDSYVDNGTYTITVYAKDENDELLGEVGSASFEITPVENTAEAIKITRSSIGVVGSYMKMLFTWDEVDYATYYEVCYTSSTGEEETLIIEDCSYAAVIKLGTTYSFSVKAYSDRDRLLNQGGLYWSVNSSSSSTKTEAVICELAGITSDGDDRYTVSYNSYDGATHYQVTAYEVSGTSYVLTDTSDYTTELETTLDLEDGKTYRIYVYAYDPSYYRLGLVGYTDITADASVAENAEFTFTLPFYGTLSAGDEITVTLPSSLTTDESVVLPIEYSITLNGVTVKLKGSDGTESGVYEQTVEIGMFARDYFSSEEITVDAILPELTEVSTTSDIVITASVDCSGYNGAPIISAEDLSSTYGSLMTVTADHIWHEGQFADISSSYVALYSITSSVTGGTITTDLVSAASGLKVTVEATAERGYELSGVTVTDADGVSVAVMDCGDGIYTFTMPSGAVTVSADVSHAHSLTKTDAVDEICLTDGNIEYWYCSVCGNYYSDEDCTTEIALEDTIKEATGHDYEAVVTEPTCTEGGYTTYTCSNCGDSYVADEAEATGHSYEKAVTEPTCTEGGYTTHTCSACGDTYTDSETEALGHNYESEVTTDATCTEAGVKTYTCTRCGDSYTEEIPATGHNYVPTETTATCTEGGYTTYVCSECGDTYTDSETEALGHDYKSVVTKEPTCTETGVMTYTCSRCGDSYTEDIDMIDHTYGEPEWTWTWSETEQTYTATAKFTCEVCGGTDTETALVTSDTTNATCTATGSTVYTAVVDMDGTAYSDTKTVELPMIPHTEGEAVTENEVAATCTTDGSYDTVIYCSVCGEELSRETITVLAIGHTEGEAVTENEVAATCATDGSYESVIYCSVCGEELSRETITVPATGHTEGNPVIENEVAATCTADGSYDTVVYCTICGAELSKETTTVPATGHTTEIRNAVDATCTEDGYTGDEVCTVCGETITVGTVIPATGHSFDSEGVCEACGAKTGEDGTASTVTVESDDTIFANVLPSGLVTSATISISNDNGGTLVVSTVVEVSAYPYLVEHIADTLSFTLYNESQGDDLISDTNSFTITTTENNKKTLKKVTILFYGDVDYSGTGTSTVTMDFASASDLSSSDIYVLHYTGSYPTWEVVTSTVTFVDTTITVEFEASDYSPFVVLSVASASSGGSSSVLDILLRISANYSSVTEAIDRANALNPSDYENFSAVTEAINAVNWNLKAINQLTVNAYADAINTAIDDLVETTANITEETVNIDEPIEGTNTETEDDGEESSETPEPESNPSTGIAFSIFPMMIAALAAASAKRR